ncbi:MAG TPA: hypothetical protein VFZ37_05310 [Jiangellaceae bacterium]
MHGPDVPAAWWIFWLIVGSGLFCGLIWTFYRLAMWSDEATWRQFVDRHKRQDAVSQERAPETSDR